jgi:uncharacterized phage protein gp47/JayE
VALYRSFNEIVASVIERLRLTQPNLDTKPGTVARDLFIDIQADQLEKLHRVISTISEKQSLLSANGADLDRWASNLNIVRRNGTLATGTVVFSTSNIQSDIIIPNGTMVSSKNGVTFKTVGTYTMSAAEKSRFAAIATRLKSSLLIAGISDTYALEVPVQAMRVGTSGNLSPLQIVSSNAIDSVNVTNLSPISGGTNSETDATFRSRIFSVFNGSNTGTASGYRNAAISTPGVLDALIVEPGNSLMLRDGTETIETVDGSFRIINSGTGGKVDIYILGERLQEIVESFVYSDLSGTGNASDDRNDIVLGVSSIDPTLTSEERRIQAFKTGNIPFQPVDSIVSVSGSSSGVLQEAFIDQYGNTKGNYKIIKDLNPETGGSPFGFDKLHFISSTKEVEAENISKAKLNSVDPLRFTDIASVSKVYQDVNIVGENAKVSLSSRSTIILNHSPVVRIRSITNKTTGEVYTITSQNTGTLSGLNESGLFTISGRTLPTPSDILSVDYTWRLIYNPSIDYNGINCVCQFKDPSISDSVDWGVSNGIFEEESIVDQTDDGLEYTISVDNNVSRVVSVYKKEITTANVALVENLSGSMVNGLEISISQPVISNIFSIKNSSGIEIYNTAKSNGSFSVRKIFLPEDSIAELGELVSIEFNKVELFNLINAEGSFSGKTITLPSTDILNGAEVLTLVQEMYTLELPVYVSYVADFKTIIPSTSLSSFPIEGTQSSNSFVNSSLTSILNSKQPVWFSFAGDQESSIQKFGATRLSVQASSTIRSGKIKISGETLTYVEADFDAATITLGSYFDLSSYIRSLYSISSIPSNLYLGRLDSAQKIENNKVVQTFDVLGLKQFNSKYSLSTAEEDSALSAFQFVLPSTPNNNSISFTSGSTIRLKFFIANSDDYEELYFQSDSTRVTDKIFARISRASVVSGFKNNIGSTIGNIQISSFNQPTSGSTYQADYSFSAPKEGERITVRYNVNRLIADVTSSIESVRPVTADVLVKEATQLAIDIRGEIVINEGSVANASSILENVNSAVVNLVNTSQLGTNIDYSDIINVVTNTSGVDSANISLFNESGKIGRRNYIQALDNQTLVPGSIQFTIVSRQNFKIS